MGNSQSFSFGVAGLGRQDAPEGRESLNRHSQPLLVPPPQQVEPTFPVPRSGRLSATKGKGDNQKKGS